MHASLSRSHLMEVLRAGQPPSTKRPRIGRSVATTADETQHTIRQYEFPTNFVRALGCSEKTASLLPRFGGCLTASQAGAIEEPEGLRTPRVRVDGLVTHIYVGDHLAARVGGQPSPAEVGIITSCSGLAFQGATVRIRPAECAGVTDGSFRICRVTGIPGDFPPRAAFETEYFLTRAILCVSKHSLEEVGELLGHLAWHGDASSRATLLGMAEARWPDLAAALRTTASTPRRSEYWASVVCFELHHGFAEVRVRGMRLWILFQLSATPVSMERFVEELRKEGVAPPPGARAYCARAPFGIASYQCVQTCIANDVVAFL